MDQLIQKEVHTFETRLKKNMPRCNKLILLAYEVLSNISITVFIILAVLTFAGLARINRLVVVYSFLPIAGLVVVKFIIDFTMTKRKEGSCTLMVCKLIVKVLVYFTTILGLLKLKGDLTSVSWATIVIPLWIVTAIVGSFFLIVFIVFFSKLVQSVLECNVNSTELVTTTWLTFNTGGLLATSIYLEFVGARYGDGKEDISILFPASMIIVCFSVVLIILTIFMRKIF